MKVQDRSRTTNRGAQLCSGDKEVRRDRVARARTIVLTPIYPRETTGESRASRAEELRRVGFAFSGAEGKFDRRRTSPLGKRFFRFWMDQTDYVFAGRASANLSWTTDGLRLYERESVVSRCDTVVIFMFIASIRVSRMYREQ